MKHYTNRTEVKGKPYPQHRERWLQAALRTKALSEVIIKVVDTDDGESYATVKTLLGVLHDERRKTRSYRSYAPLGQMPKRVALAYTAAVESAEHYLKAVELLTK